jgi:geranylgeranyl pyrophosphate synthase
VSDNVRINPWLARVATKVGEAGDLRSAYLDGRAPQTLALHGKMVRARLLLLAADALGALGEPAADLAAGVEMIHNASLLHDDVVDQATMRRGHAALYRTDGACFAIMAGDVCFARAMGLICRAEQLAVYRAVARAVADLATGQLAEWVARDADALPFEHYFSIIDRKTGSLISLCLELAGVLAGASDENLRRLCDAGRLLGRAFQVADDMLDFRADAADTGKDAFADLAEGKLTYPYLAILHGADANAAELVRRALGDPHFPADELRAAFFTNGLEQRCRAFLDDCVGQARALLAPVFGADRADGLFRYFEDLAFRNR